MEPKKNKDKLVSKKKEQPVQEPEKKPTLSRKEAFLDDLKNLFHKHNLNSINYIQNKDDGSISINYFVIDIHGDNIQIKSREMFESCGWTF